MGKFDLWEEAESASTGYAAPEILKRTRAAMAKVKNDEAIFERDSVLLATPEYPFPLIVGLLRAALLADGRLSVLDFGGALGSTYFQCRKFLSAVKDMRWSVVEQPDHVACGQAEFSNEELRFYPTAEECLTSQRPNLLLLSSVLQYLPAPYDMLRQLLTYRIPHVVIDRTAFLVGNRERLSVQSVPKSIYQATYPAWFFNEPKFVAFCNEMNYKLVADFDGADHVSLSQPQEESYFKGFIFDLEERS
ncbi:MAG TPA: methyltransferase, TIGR04325 family [Blastocatellia bacterium]|nr:methyltransferase, TIGR04325 family [Blastocatellia bacterium]